MTNVELYGLPERDYWRARCERAEADADRLFDALGTERDIELDEWNRVQEAHRAAVAQRHPMRFRFEFNRRLKREGTWEEFNSLLDHDGHEVVGHSKFGDGLAAEFGDGAVLRIYSSELQAF